MPAIAEILAKRAGIGLEAVQDTADIWSRDVLEYFPELEEESLNTLLQRDQSA